MNYRSVLEKLTGPNGPWRFRVEKWLWVVLCPVLVLTPLGDSVTIVSFMSAYALVLTLAGAEQAAEARVAATTDPP